MEYKAYLKEDVTMSTRQLYPSDIITRTSFASVDPRPIVAHSSSAAAWTSPSSIVTIRPMNVVINGEQCTIPDGVTVKGLLDCLNVKEDRIAVERNREIVPRARWDTTPLEEGDALEIVHFVGGGSQDARASVCGLRPIADPAMDAIGGGKSLLLFAIRLQDG